MKKLIVNADDFGLDENINNGIIKGFKEGFITSTSIMPNAPFFNRAVELAKENPKLGIGIHLTLVGGLKPLKELAKVKTLVNSSGFFYSDYIFFIKQYLLGRINKKEIKEELEEQIKTVLDKNLNVTHVDSHQHLHVLPGITEIVVDLCQKYNIKQIRLPLESMAINDDKSGFDLKRQVGKSGLNICSLLAKRIFAKNNLLYPDNFFGMSAGGNLNSKNIAGFLKVAKNGTNEIMTHPGFNNDFLNNKFGWDYHWENELMGFLDVENKQSLKNLNIDLINFGDLNE
jgi:hopanoid biosynthesis associated protein HpnK